jgi:succinate dehydrogenase / fumarate reductase flavoprotein subunit
VISKLQPLRSHTGSAEGGIAASLGNIEEDSWQWHYKDTIKGGDWLVDQDAAKILTEEAPRTVVRLEHDGVAFSRTPDGHIAQRKFGGHTANGVKPVKRVAYAADRIGHQILHTLWQQCQRYSIDFADEWYVTDLVLTRDSTTPTVAGIIALEESSGRLRALESPVVVLATGGAGRLYHTTSNSWDLTGDGMGLSLSAGLQLEDSEFVQFHPTGLAHTGILLSEASRGEGGILRNSTGEAFMQRYAPGVGDLAARDVVARAINQEVAEGRGVPDPLSPDSGNDCVWLDLRSIGQQRLAQALPEVCETIREFAGLDPSTDLVPIKPTAHYTMGGIPITLDGSVYTLDSGGSTHIVSGLKAAGECSCVSVHGANRLGANSLLDAIVFGTRTGNSIAHTDAASASVMTGVDADASTRALDETLSTRQEELSRLLSPAKGSADDTALSTDNAYQLMKDLGAMMEAHLGVSCDATSIGSAITLLRQKFLPRCNNLVAHNSSPTFNQELCAIMEARNLVSVALIMATSTLARHESRGSLYRADYPGRDDNAFLAHSFVGSNGNVDYKPVVIDDYPPEERTY